MSFLLTPIGLAVNCSLLPEPDGGSHDCPSRRIGPLMRADEVDANAVLRAGVGFPYGQCYL